MYQAHLSYKGRLLCLNLTTLEDRRKRGDLLEAFKIIKGLDKVISNGNFLLQDKTGHHKTRGHSLKLLKPCHKTWKQSQFFSSSVLNSWNLLPEKVVNSTSMNMFKHNYDNYSVPNMTRRQPS